MVDSTRIVSMSIVRMNLLILGYYCIEESKASFRWTYIILQTNVDNKVVSVPWPTLLTGMMFIQVFYWSTNQVIVQRAMAAKSLAEGQKGVLFASAMKLVGPLMLCLPGIIALHMTDLTIDKQDQVYGAIVRHVLPDWSLGLFAAVLMGSILSSFNSALNSATALATAAPAFIYVGEKKNAHGDMDKTKEAEENEKKKNKNKKQKSSEEEDIFNKPPAFKKRKKDK